MRYSVINNDNQEEIDKVNVLHADLFQTNKSFITKNLDKVHILGLYNNVDEIVSYLVYKMLDGENACYISFLGTDPKYRGKGLATLLVEQLKQIATELELDNINLSVRASSESVKRLYESLGFEQSEFVPEAYKNQGGYRYSYGINKELDGNIKL